MKTIGIIGGGQLCLMMGEDTKNKSLPYKLLTLDPTNNCPASAFVSKQILGSFKDQEKIEQLAKESEVVTFEIELANADALQKLQDEGKEVHPCAHTLKIIQDKHTQSEFLQKSNVPVPKFFEINSADDLDKAIDSLGLPLMLKARTDGYDGKGNVKIADQKDKENIASELVKGRFMAQQFISFDCEVSVIAARSKKGEVKFFPVAENIHDSKEHILKTSIVPSRVDTKVQEKAKEVAMKVMQAFSDVGVFGIEMFAYGDNVLVNEIAPRVHNTGHYTIEACDVSQFEQHLYAVAGEELKSSDSSKMVVMHNILGGENQKGSYRMLFDEKQVKQTQEVEQGVFVHNYEKHRVKPYGKMGHITILARDGESQEDLIARSYEIEKRIVIENETTD